MDCWPTCAETTIVPKDQILDRLDPPPGTSTSNRVLLRFRLLLALLLPPVVRRRVEFCREKSPDATDPIGLGVSPLRLPWRLKPPPPKYEWKMLDIRCSTERKDTLSGSYSNDDSESEKDVWVWTCSRNSCCLIRASIFRLWLFSGPPKQEKKSIEN